MTVSVLFQPHSDDAALFAAYTCIEHSPHVITVLQSRLQQERGGASHEQREAEDECAFAVLGITDYTQWPYPDSDPDWGAVENAMRLLDERITPTSVFAPAPELGGHGQHNQVGDLAEKVFGGRVGWYLTYRRGHGRSVGAVVEFEPGWAALKAEALDCYRSQIADPSTRPWFVPPYLLEYRPETAAA